MRNKQPGFARFRTDQVFGEQEIFKGVSGPVFEGKPIQRSPHLCESRPGDIGFHPGERDPRLGKAARQIDGFDQTSLGRNRRRCTAQCEQIGALAAAEHEYSIDMIGQWWAREATLKRRHRPVAHGKHQQDEQHRCGEDRDPPTYSSVARGT